MKYKYKIYVFQDLKLIIIMILNRYVCDICFTILTYSKYLNYYKQLFKCVLSIITYKALSAM